MDFGSKWLSVGTPATEDFFTSEITDGIAAVAEEQANAWALEAEQSNGDRGFLSSVQRLGHVFAQSVRATPFLLQHV